MSVDQPKNNPQPCQSQNTLETHAVLEHDGLTFEVLEDEHTHEGIKVRSKGIYLFPNLVTSIAFLCGFYSIIQSSTGHYFQAIVAIFFAALFDGLDGRIARWTNAQSAFGEQYDSLSDLLSFGVAPAMLIYTWVLHSLGRFGLACAFIFAVCAALRLARFNVQIGIVDKRYFVGLASPIAACTLISAILVGIYYPAYIDVSMRVFQYAFALFAVLMGFLMISNIRYFSFKEMDKKRVPFVMILPVLLVLTAIANDFPIGLLATGIAYALSGIIMSVYLKLKARTI